MDLMILENIWKEHDRKLGENIRLNKEILRRLLTEIPRKRIGWMKFWSGYRLFDPLIFLLVLVVADFKFTEGIQFYIGITLFAASYGVSYITSIKYFSLIRRIDFTDNILILKKKVAELKKCKIKITQIRYASMPFAILSAFLLLFQRIDINTKSLIFFVLVFLVFLLSLFYTFKYSVYEKFKKLNEEIEKIENLEKDNT